MSDLTLRTSRKYINKILVLFSLLVICQNKLVILPFNQLMYSEDYPVGTKKFFISTETG